MKKKKCKHSNLHITELYNIHQDTIIATQVKCEKCGKYFPHIAKVLFNRISISGGLPYAFDINKFKNGGKYGEKKSFSKVWSESKK